ncbi:DUF2798 domain-containing protein [Falsirhodobacter deserti]|uniref:DUF2798 domain-containing protein n=1 Tax=Falsirhodobacter deserti TaxID=1365611 RepID=UPI000FE34862|nr:DUF2798 domain-containing protein [Falsirhodobacter deserti]
MIPARYASILFAFLLSGMMSCIVSGVAITRAAGIDAGLPVAWLQAWLSSWCVAFPSVMVLAPVTRRIVARLTA